MKQSKLPSNHQTIVDRFIAVGQANARIVAAFLGGSYASGAADAHSDLDLSARNQRWFAYGSLETMRHICVNLARLRHNFADAEAGEEPFFKIEQAIPVEQLAPLQATFCPLELEAIRQAGAVLLQFYREVATILAERHGLVYPTALERVMLAQ